jgi:FkbM family methyltransferase
MMEQMIHPSYDEVLGAIAEIPQGSWLQIGANTMGDQDAKDPLKEWLDLLPGPWKKYFVEPIPSLFDKLQQTIEKWPNSTAVNVAISPDGAQAESQAEMFCVREAMDFEEEEEEEERKAEKEVSPNNNLPELPYWANQVCSFDRSHVLRHFPKESGRTIVTVPVTAWSLKEFLRRQQIGVVEVMVIDTEGFDYQVLKQIPFQHGTRPRLIVYEHQHLSKEDQEAAKALLRSHCYTVWELDSDNHAALALYV